MAADRVACEIDKTDWADDLHIICDGGKNDFLFYGDGKQFVCCQMSGQ